MNVAQASLVYHFYDEVAINNSADTVQHGRVTAIRGNVAQYCIGRVVGTYNESVLNIETLQAKQTYLAKLHPNFSVIPSINLSIPQSFTVIPHTHKVKPYLSFTITGTNLNSELTNGNFIKAVGKVVYENIRHKFILVKVSRRIDDEIVSKILKFDGVLGSNKDAVETLWEITANCEGHKLVIQNASRVTYPDKSTKVSTTKMHKAIGAAIA